MATYESCRPSCCVTRNSNGRKGSWVKHLAGCSCNYRALCGSSKECRRAAAAAAAAVVVVAAEWSPLAIVVWVRRGRDREGEKEREVSSLENTFL